MMPTEVAPAGAMYVCAACGKRSRDSFGEEPYDRGWDASCMLNAVLVKFKPNEAGSTKRTRQGND